MEIMNEQFRKVLREVEARAANALAHQPEDPRENFCHLNKALAGIELRVYCARRGIDTAPVEKEAK